MDLIEVGLLLDIIGFLLVFFFGIPSIKALNTGAYVGNKDTPKIRSYKWLAGLGATLILLGFLLQLIGNMGSQ